MNDPPLRLLAFGLVLALAALIFGSDLGGGMKPFKATVTDGRLDVSTFTRRDTRIDLAEIERVELLFALPEELSRLESKSLFGRRRGYYETEDQGEVMVLLDSEDPPFIYVRGVAGDGGKRKQLLLRWQDEAATRDLFEAIESELQHRAPTERLRAD